MRQPPQPLATATLQAMTTQPTNPRTTGDPITVQFNPTTLRLAMQNSVDMKKAFGKRPATQYDGTSSSTLSFDLVFDTADEGTSDTPVDVRTRVAPIEQFLLPASGERKSIPPRVQFTYGSMQLIGVMTSLNADYDLFSSHGIPLRAKVGVTIKEQLPEYEQGAAGSGANTGAAAQDTSGLLPPGGAGTPTAPDRTGTAIAGESAPDFASRMGLDPAAWKSLDLGGLDPLSLTAGVRIDFDASLTVDLGLTSGVSAGTSSSAPIFAGTRPPAPFAVTAGGGLQRALDHDAEQTAGAAAASARAAFGVAGPPSPSAAAPDTVPTSPVGPDPRALGFGRGVPMRPSLRAPAPFGRLPRWSERTVSGEAATTDDPSVPGWVALHDQFTPPTGYTGACSGSCAGGGGGRCGGTCGGATVTSRPRPFGVATAPAVTTARRTTPVHTQGCGGCWGCR